MFFFLRSVFASWIDPFDRRNAEMEKEIADLRRRLGPHSDHEQTGELHDSHEPHGGDEMSHCSEDVFSRRESAVVDQSRHVSVPVETHPSIATPLAMKRDGSIISQDEGSWKLEDISLSRGRVVRLYEQYGLFLLCLAALINQFPGISHIITHFFHF